MVQPDPAQDRQPEGDPEGQPPVIDHVEDGDRSEQVVDRRQAERPHRSDRHHPREECNPR